MVDEAVAVSARAHGNRYGLTHFAGPVCDAAGLTTFLAQYDGAVVALTADNAETPRLPAEWLAPVDAFFSSLLRKVADESIPDAVLLDAIELAIAGMPGLIEAMDVDALAETLEAGLGQAVLAKAKSRKQKAEITALSADGEGIAFAPLAEAVAKLDRRTPVGAMLTSAQWARVPLALRERAFFSAKVESVRFLAEAQEKLRMRLSLEKENLANGKSAFVDRGSFVMDMQRIAAEEGIQTTDESGRGTVRDIRSVRRLNLIYDQQTRQAQEYARWKMDHDADVLDEFPAYRLGESTADNPRDEAFWRGRWAEAGSSVGWEGALQEDMVALKTSPIWQALSRFGTPWPPFDYGSQRDLDDVDRQEAEALGLLDPNAPVPEFDGGSGREFDGETGAAMGFNDKLEASVQKFSEWDRKEMEIYFGDQVQVHNGIMKWQGNLIGDLVDDIIKAGLDTPFDNKAFAGRSLNLGKATPRTLAAAEIGGVDLTGSHMQLTPDVVHHILRRHGEGRELNPNQIAVMKRDMELLPHVWRDPDNVLKNKDDPNRPFLRKRIVGVDVMVVWDKYRQGEYIPVSMRIESVNDGVRRGA
jgi:hypothetical protein